MRKREYVRLFQEKLKEQGLELTHEKVGVVLDTFKELVVDIFKSGEDTIINGFLKIGSREIAACEKTHTLPSKKGESYTIQASTNPTIKFTTSFVKENKISK